MRNESLKTNVFERPLEIPEEYFPEDLNGFADDAEHEIESYLQDKIANVQMRIWERKNEIRRYA